MSNWVDKLINNKLLFFSITNQHWYILGVAEQYCPSQAAHRRPTAPL